MKHEKIKTMVISAVVGGVVGGVVVTTFVFLIQAFVYKNPAIFGNVADWFSAFGTIVAASVALYFGLRPALRNYKIELYQGNVNYPNDERKWTTINFAMYNSGNKPFVLYKAYLEGENAENLELDFNNSDYSYSYKNMPFLLEDNTVEFLYLCGTGPDWVLNKQPKNPFIILQEGSGEKIKIPLKKFIVEEV
ncbi:hypothetical protein [Weissella bombi]|uniref:hypothetical protein n=1 Tax=Weissella bombi TaxID=1505725 RepID=UPI003AF2F85C